MSRPHDDDGVREVVPLGASAESPASEEERIAAEQLRDALERNAAEDDDEAHVEPDGHVEVVSLLRTAWNPAPLDEQSHRSIVAELASTAEVAEAEALRAALETGDVPEVVGLLRATWAPRPLGELEHRRTLAPALGRGASRPRASRWALAVPTALALAASFVVWVSSAPRSEAPIARVRSTASLFDEPFQAGQTSARIDRIAVARAADYRDNRFTAWGLR